MITALVLDVSTAAWNVLGEKRLNGDLLPANHGTVKLEGFFQRVLVLKLGVPEAAEPARFLFAWKMNALHIEVAEKAIGAVKIPLIATMGEVREICGQIIVFVARHTAERNLV